MNPNCKIQSLNQEASRMNARVESIKNDVNDSISQKEINDVRKKLTIIAVAIVLFLSLYILL
ncbi:MAG: hypothetical protein IKM20_01735 [Erysipelotrichales bacterium]|nr:hypothetical protein [Erysipelotrichales bacterium]